MLRVAMREHRGGEDVALGRARRQAGGGPEALHVDDDRRHLGVVGEAGELGHQRDARARSGRHRSCARPAGPEGHADGRELVLGLDDREGGLPGLLVDPILLHVVDERLADRRGGRDRVPGDNRDARHHGADRHRRVGLDQDLAARLVHPLDAEPVALREVLLGVRVARGERGLVERHGLGLLAELPVQGLLHLGHLDPEQLRQDAVVDHVAHEAAQLGVRADRLDELVERHRVEHQVRAHLVELERLVVHDRRARIERQGVFAGRLGVHRHEQVDFLLAADVAVPVRPDGVPGGQAGDVRREEVLPRHRDAHLEQRANEHEVGRLAPRAVDGGHLDAEVVDDLGRGRLRRRCLNGRVR